MSSIDSQYLSIPVSQGVHAVHLLRKLQEGYPTWGSLEKKWRDMGRKKIDETGSSDWTQKVAADYYSLKEK